MKPQLINKTLTPPDPPEDKSYEETERLIEAVRKAGFDPEDIFEIWQLERWAEMNGYIKIEDNKDY